MRRIYMKSVKVETEMTMCRFCGTIIDGDADFCSEECAVRFEEEQNRPGPHPAQEYRDGQEECMYCPDSWRCQQDDLWINCCAIENHGYSEFPCDSCGHFFCYACSSNWIQGAGENGRDLTVCPVCGHSQTV